MAIALRNEQNILDEDFRSKIIQEIEGPENQERKADSKKRYEIYRDKTKHYVAERIKNEFLSGNAEKDKLVWQTVKELCSRASNISILKKIVSKKAVIYKQDITREVYDLDGNLLPDETDKMSKIYREINANASYKKINKINEYQKNAVGYVRPYEVLDNSKFRYEIKPLQPYGYDVIENEQNKEEAIVYIISTYKQRKQMYSSTEAEAAKHGAQMSFGTGDGRDQTIADSVIDEEIADKRFIWWSKNYHFVTDENGRRVSEGGENEFEILNFYDFSTEKDGHFWAIGGDDLVDGSILINLLLTDLQYILKYQGFGFFYAFGKDLPETIMVGPRQGITGQLREGDPTPIVGFANPSAPIGDHMTAIEQYLAFLLSTNNLEPGQIQGQLSATSAESGIQEIIKRSESTGDVEDSEQYFRNGERHIYESIKKIHNLYFERGHLDPALAKIGPLRQDTYLSVRFNRPEIYSSEKDRLEVLKLRKDLGLDTMLDTIMRDNPHLSEKEAIARLEKSISEKVQRAQESMKLFMGGQDGAKSNLQSEDTDDDDRDGQEE